MTAALPGEPTSAAPRASVLRDEPIAGTASTVRAYLLIEHPGAWGEDALRDARLPDGLGAELRRRAARGAGPGAADPSHRSAPGR